LNAVKQSKLLFLFIILCSFTAKALPPGPPGQRYGFSAAGGGVISFFKVDTRHSEAAKMRAGASAIFRMNLYATSTVHIQCGLELMTQACRFNTYYFAPGYSQFYDRSFGYTHTLRTVELYVPIMARIGLSGPESNARTIFYLLAGYAPKLFLTSVTSIVKNDTGKEIWGGSTELDYEHQFLGAQTGNVLIAGMGLDRRLGFTEKFLTYEIIFRYNLSRFIYHGRMGIENTNELFLKNCCINFQIGYRFE
jgi:hypothetical protein